MKRIGILGGTFNPVHNSHLMLAKQAYQQFKLDCVLFMPSKHPPHKDNSLIVSDEHRLNMLHAAVDDFPYFEVSDFELKREGTTYTSDTLSLLTQQNPDNRYFFIIGGDSLDQFDKWHEPSVILSKCALVCTGRSDFNRNLALKQIEQLRFKYTSEDFVPEIHYLTSPLMDISSREIRTDVSCNYDISSLVPEKVNRYILDNKLYQSALFEYIKSDIKTKLSEHRYQHVLSVAQTAYEIAKCTYRDPSKAYLAGLLHDCAKYLTADEQIFESRRLGIRITPLEKKLAGSVLHAKVGAYYAGEVYGVEDNDIFNAIYFHTTGRSRMTILEKIIYIADFVEPLRTINCYPSLENINAIAKTDLNEACYLVMHSTKRYLSGKQPDDICPIFFTAYSYYKRLHDKRLS